MVESVAVVGADLIVNPYISVESAAMAGLVEAAWMVVDWLGSGVVPEKPAGSVVFVELMMAERIQAELIGVVVVPYILVELFVVVVVVVVEWMKTVKIMISRGVVQIVVVEGKKFVEGIVESH